MQAQTITIASITNKAGAVMVCKAGQWAYSVCAWMTGGKMPTTTEAEEILKDEAPKATDREITEALQALQDEAYSMEEVNTRFGLRMEYKHTAWGTINGRSVRVSLIIGYRNNGAKRRPGCAWYVDGKRVAVDNLRDAIKG